MIRRREFRKLLEYSLFFGEMASVFETMDTDHDGHIDRNEFAAGVSQSHIHVVVARNS